MKISSRDRPVYQFTSNHWPFVNIPPQLIENGSQPRLDSLLFETITHETEFFLGSIGDDVATARAR